SGIALTGHDRKLARTCCECTDGLWPGALLLLCASFLPVARTVGCGVLCYRSYCGTDCLAFEPFPFPPRRIWIWPADGLPDLDSGCAGTIPALSLVLEV